MTGQLTISGTSPQMKFNDTDADDFWIHANGNTFYVLSDRDDSGGWETPYPLELRNSSATGVLYGQRIFAENYHPNADVLTTARTIAGTSFNGSANIAISYNNLTNLPTIPSVSGLAPIASPTFTGTVTTPNLTIGSGNRIKFANNDHIRYDDTANRFHFDADGGSSNASVQAVTFVGALSGNATTATTLATARTIAGTSFNGSANIAISYNNLTNIPTNRVIKDSLTANSTSSVTTFTSAAAINTTAGGQSSLQVYNPTSGNDAFITFHVSGDLCFLLWIRWRNK